MDINNAPDIIAFRNAIESVAAIAVTQSDIDAVAALRAQLATLISARELEAKCDAAYNRVATAYASTQR